MSYGVAPSQGTLAWMFYLILTFFMFIDMWLLKKIIHKWANKFTSKEIRQRQKAAKREKKRMKYEQMLAAMQNLEPYEYKNFLRNNYGPLERQIWKKERAL